MGLLSHYSNLAHCGEEISYSLGEHKTIKYVRGINNYSFQYVKTICKVQACVPCSSLLETKICSGKLSMFSKLTGL